MRTTLSAAILLLVFAASMLLQTNAQDLTEKTCEETYGDQQNWPSWVPVCYNNGTCMLYFPSENDPYPFPYCICEPPYTGITCETYDWNSEPSFVAQAGIGLIVSIVIGFIFFDALVIVTIIYCRSKKAKKSSETTHRNSDTASVDQNDNEMQLVQETAALAAPTTTTRCAELQEQCATGSIDKKLVDSVAVDEEVTKRVHIAEHATPLKQPLPTRVASVRASRLLPPGDIYYIDEADEDGVDVDSSAHPMLVQPNNSSP